MSWNGFISSTIVEAIVTVKLDSGNKKLGLHVDNKSIF